MSEARWDQARRDRIERHIKFLVNVFKRRYGLCYGLVAGRAARTNREEWYVSQSGNGGVAAMALVVGSHSANGQETLNFTIATGHPEVFLWVKHLKATFIPVLAEELAKTNEVKINWTEGYGGTIVKLGSEVEAFQQGIMEVGQMSGVFNPAQLGLLNLTYAMPFGPADPRAVTEAVEKALTETEGALSAVEEATGIVYIGGGIAIDDYNIAATKAFQKMADMEGVKIGGAGPNLAWLNGTGAVGVQGSYVTFYNDIKTGVYDGNIG